MSDLDRQLDQAHQYIRELQQALIKTNQELTSSLEIRDYNQRMFETSNAEIRRLSAEIETLKTPTKGELTRAQRTADAVTAFSGSWTFIYSAGVFLVGWLTSQKFDPYPFILLNLVVTVIELFQGPLILMAEHRQMERDREATQSLHTKLDMVLGLLHK